MDMLAIRTRANLPHTFDRFEQSGDALLARFTMKPLLAGDFERD